MHRQTSNFQFAIATRASLRSKQQMSSSDALLNLLVRLASLVRRRRNGDGLSRDLALGI